ncbi:unnamed protein product [Dibothriocephalus latus]|uniref:Uncharacterized protein n=1 Tax=Dibothriocephalus latus TaxID=60516 RepID=A0A3P7NHL6_DIBLA|nr:unnamed protein product [Dibothriocephalus latus]
MPFSDPVVPEEAEQRSLYDTLIESSSTMPTILQQLADHAHLEESVCSFYSTLVLTGVYQEIHPNLPHLPNLRVPNFVAQDVEEAIKYILFLEGELKEPVQVTRSCPYLDDENDYHD